MFGLKRQQAQEIQFDNLKVGDKLILSTENSQYQFKVTNPTDRRGILSGGQLGDQAHEAVLYCLKDDEAAGQIDEKAIKTNSKAIFFLQTRRGLQRLLTSIITNLRLVREQYNDMSFKQPQSSI